MNTKKTVIATALGTVLGLGAMATVEAAVINASWDGLFTLLTPTGAPHANTSYPYYDDPTWGYGLRTQVSGSLSFDTNTGAGSATVGAFQFWDFGAALHDITLQAIGDGFGGGGTLVVGSMLFDWGGHLNMSVGIVLDAAGLIGAGPFGVGQVISGVGAIPASNAIAKGSIAVGPAPIATTSWDTDYHNDPACVNASGCLIFDGSMIGGDPLDNGIFTGYGVNLDITSINMYSITTVPVPASVWLLGSGLLGVLGASRRRK